ncbi:hypothetical protein SNOG_16160 [Parastagonospora nodorum SN15]|uniref:Uncharacterized protein n=1 Tax=Phaeosphaeria nodorum (strain SN15 / ATCC MYA-4574 / FGSC 10173) TaxID=321614 RepID=Q0TWN2_PHANO|nr:hypothetical protein SNOG_16160 [Parastagonospora nodorum SN15]EAT76532.1 hypothetical protein SNOG_16160 [Parastagonospora nodorum SN15]
MSGPREVSSNFACHGNSSDELKKKGNNAIPVPCISGCVPKDGRQELGTIHMKKCRLISDHTFDSVYSFEDFIDAILALGLLKTLGYPQHDSPYSTFRRETVTGSRKSNISAAHHHPGPPYTLRYEAKIVGQPPSYVYNVDQAELGVS